MPTPTASASAVFGDPGPTRVEASWPASNDRVRAYVCEGARSQRSVSARRERARAASRRTNESRCDSERGTTDDRVPDVVLAARLLGELATAIEGRRHGAERQAPAADQTSGGDRNTAQTIERQATRDADRWLEDAQHRAHGHASVGAALGTVEGPAQDALGLAGRLGARHKAHEPQALDHLLVYQAIELGLLLLLGRVFRAMMRVARHGGGGAGGRGSERMRYRQRSYRIRSDRWEQGSKIAKSRDRETANTPPFLA